MYVLKADGRKEEFSEEKIVKTCMRAGIAPDAAKAVAKKISACVQNGMTTHKIYTMILDELDKSSSSIFMLREAVANLDPLSFELFVKKVLEAHGYKCAWNKLIKGANVEHQVDIIATEGRLASSRGEKTYLVECKRHFNPHRFTGLNICLQVEARLNDIMAGNKAGKNKYNFNTAWVVTNTKFSDHAKMYAKGVGIRLTGWHYEEQFALEKMIEAKKVLPVTILKCDISIHRQLLNKKVITLQDLISEGSRKDLVSQAKSILNML